MGSILATCAASCLASCTGSCIGGVCRVICGGEDGDDSGATSRFAFLILFFMTSLISLLLRAYGGQTLIHLFLNAVPLCHTDVCLGNQVVLRLSYSLAVLFSFTTISQLSKKTSAFHSTLWTLKLFLLMILVFTSFLLPNNFFAVYANIARFASILFLVIQNILLIEFAYSINEELVSRGTKWQYFIIAGTIISNIICIVIWINLYSMFAADDTCSTNDFLISFFIVLSLAWTILSASNRTQGGIMTSSVLTVFGTYLLFSGLRRDPGLCNTLSSSDDSSQPVTMFMGFIATTASLTWSAWRMTTSRQDLLSQRHSFDDEMLVPLHDDEIDVDTMQQNFFFHIIMLFASLYMAMLLSNWTTIDSNETMTMRSTASKWANISSVWMAALMYMWSMVAPMILPDREF